MPAIDGLFVGFSATIEVPTSAEGDKWTLRPHEKRRLFGIRALRQ